MLNMYLCMFVISFMDQWVCWRPLSEQVQVEKIFAPVYKGFRHEAKHSFESKQVWNSYKLLSWLDEYATKYCHVLVRYIRVFDLLDGVSFVLCERFLLCFCLRSSEDAPDLTVKNIWW